MTRTRLTETLPAHTTHTPDPTSDQIPGEGVRAMTGKKSRKRAWDEMSETDRRVLLQSVRARREAQSARDAVELEVREARRTV